MKQLFICKKNAYATSAAKATDLTTVPEGTIALFSLRDGALLTAAPTSNFSIAVGRATGKMPLMFPEVDVKSLQVTKASYEASKTFTAKITVPTPEKGTHYTVVITKKGTVFNERSKLYYLSLYNSDNDPIFLGVAVIPGYPIGLDYALNGLTGFFWLEQKGAVQSEPYKLFPDKLSEYYTLSYSYIDGD